MGFAPPGFRQDLHLAGARKALRLDRRPELCDLDHAVAHHAAVEQEVAGRHQPVADVEGVDALAAGAGDLGVDFRVPPDVIDVDGEAEPLARLAGRAGRRCRAPGGACSRRRGRPRTSDAAARWRARRPSWPHSPAASASASSTCARAPAMSREGAEPGRENCGRPPTTSTRHGAPSAAASSTARRLSSRTSARCAGSAGNMPPRQ